MRSKQKNLTQEKKDEESSSKKEESNEEEVSRPKQLRREDRDLNEGRSNAALIFWLNFG